MDQGGTEVGLGSAHIVLDENPAPQRKGAQQPSTFWPMSIVAKRSPILATDELLSVLASGWRNRRQLMCGMQNREEISATDGRSSAVYFGA